MRKEADFQVMDHIRVALNGNEKLLQIAEANRKTIADKVLADELGGNREYAVSKEWNVNGETVTISVEQVK